MISEATRQSMLRQMAEEVGEMARPFGYALFLRFNPGEQWTYMSNAKRRDVAKSLLSWHNKITDKNITSSIGMGGPTEVLKRASYIGHEFSEEDVEAIVFCFELGTDNGTLAFWANVRDFADSIATWCQKETSR